MLVNPLLVHAPNAVLLLDTACRILDPNVVINESNHEECRETLAFFKGNIPKMMDAAEESLPSSAPEHVREMVQMEISLVRALARVAGYTHSVSKNTNHVVMGRSGWPAYTRGELNLVPGGYVDGILHKGPSMLGVSCMFTVRSSGTAASRWFWVDNLTGMPCGEWLAERADCADYLTEFRGGPWKRFELSDSELCALSIKSASVFCDYQPYRFHVSDNDFSYRFRFDWTKSMHSADLRAERDNIANIQREVEDDIF